MVRHIPAEKSQQHDPSQVYLLPQIIVKKIPHAILTFTTRGTRKPITCAASKETAGIQLLSVSTHQVNAGLALFISFSSKP